jgi:hypothetical protein
MTRDPDLLAVTEPPARVTLHLWGVAPQKVPAALLRMGTDRLRLRRTPGLRFAKLLGTGNGRTFTMRDADPLHWGLLATWESVPAAEDFESGQVAQGWGRLSRERLRVDLRPIASRGQWSRRAPFGAPTPTPYDGELAALTRARLVPRRMSTFWRAVPPVSGDLRHADGLRFSVGIGEAPVGLQGTFSIWRSAEALHDFAYRRGPHSDVIRRTATEGWYAEELFARFAVLSVQGTFAGREV